MRLVNSEINVRAARAEDKGAILAFCQNTFHWGDYIAEAWDGWLADAGGQMFVAIAEAKPVGLIHAKILEGGVGWLEGMRVHPDFRRHGISTALDRAAHNFACTRACRIVRLATSEKNLAAQKTIAAQGYAIVARFGEWNAPAAPGDCARVATFDDAEKILDQWRAFPARAAGNVLLPNRDWRWTYLTRTRVRAQIESAEVRTLDNGWMFLLAYDEGDWHSLVLHALVGDTDAICALAHAARAEAAYRGYATVEANVADDAPINHALARAGFTRGSGMLIAEQVL
jgi:GNAT superfamily N-acetyltransferase